jgi:hypothetical protein
MNDQRYFCPTNGSSCYLNIASSQSYDAGKVICQNRGGYAVALNTCTAHSSRTMCILFC